MYTLNCIQRLLRDLAWSTVTLRLHWMHTEYRCKVILTNSLLECSISITLLQFAVGMGFCNSVNPFPPERVIHKAWVSHSKPGNGKQAKHVWIKGAGCIKMKCFPVTNTSRNAVPCTMENFIRVLKCQLRNGRREKTSIVLWSLSMSLA